MAMRLGKPLFGLDSTSMVPVSGHKAVGSSFAGRYVSRESWKCLKPGEAQLYKDGGIGLIVLFEDGSGNALMGHSQGQSDAGFAVEQAKGLGVTTGAIFMTVDSGVAPEAVDAYFDGARVILGDRCGIYGSKAVVDRQMSRGVKYGYQTLAWSGGEVSSLAQVYQYDINHTVDGVGVDYDRAFFDDYGQVDYAPPVAPDPNHYARFQAGPFPYRGTKLNEREIVKHYDKLRAEQTFVKHPHREELAVLRVQLAFLAQRILFQASKGAMPAWGSSEPGLDKYHREWRVKQLKARAAGKRVAKKSA